MYGISTITAALAANRRDLYTLYVQAGVLAMWCLQLQLQSMQWPKYAQCRNDTNNQMRNLPQSCMLICQMCSGLDTVKRKDGGALARAISAASRAEVAISTVSKHELNDLVGNRPHQASLIDSVPAGLCYLAYLPFSPQLPCDSGTSFLCC